MNFSYLNTTRIQFGQGQIDSIKKLIPSNKKVLVIYGFGSIKKNGVYDQVVSALDDYDWLEFSGVETNPTVENREKISG